MDSCLHKALNNIRNEHRILGLFEEKLHREVKPGVSVEPELPARW